MTNQPKFQTIYEATESLCKTATDGNNGTETTLEEWMREGNWQTMTPAEMAAEWDDLTEEYENN